MQGSQHQAEYRSILLTSRPRATGKTSGNLRSRVRNVFRARRLELGIGGFHRLPPNELLCRGWTGTAVMRTLSMTPATVSLERR